MAKFFENTCRHQETTESPRIFINGTKHIEVSCKQCGAYLRFISHKPKEDYVLFFGKYNGKTFKFVAEHDPSYCFWIINSGALRKNQIDVMRSFLK